MSEDATMATSSDRSFERERPVSPAPSGVSMTSDRSKDDPINFSKAEQRSFERERPVSPAPSGVSMTSDRSKDDPINFSKAEQRSFERERPVSPAPSDVSMTSDRSKDDPINFSKAEQRSFERGRPVSPAPSGVSMTSDRSKDDPINFSKAEQSSHQSQTPASSNVSPKSDKSEDVPPSRGSGSQEKNPKRWPDLKTRIISQYKEKLSQDETNTALYEIKKDGQKKLSTYNDLFTGSGSWLKNIFISNEVRTVLTKGVHDIGKTFQTQKFMVEWANGKTNKDIDLIVSLSFSELNSRREDQSMKDFLNNYFNNVNQVASINDTSKIAFVLDGLENCELPLDFKKNKELTDMTKAASMDVLLTNLIKGKLLPSARLWIISQPSGVNKIPSKYIEKVTECQAKDAKDIFTDNLKKGILEKYKNEQSQHKMVTELWEIKENKIDKQNLVETTYDQMFNSAEVRTVLTKGVAGISKTLQIQKFMVEWAKGKTNKDIDLIVSLSFSELNSRREDQSMKDFLNNYFNNVKQQASIYEKCKIAFVLDDLEKCKLPLDFKNNNELTDMKEAASMDVLLTNLIKGKLLPSARLWIISQPSGVDKIPPEYIHKVTECQAKDAIKNLTQQLKTEILKKYEEEVKKCDSDLYEIKNQEDEQTSAVYSYNQISVSSLFNSEKEKARTVLTKGVARIGKTFQTKMFMVDWAKGNSNKDIHLIVSLSFNKPNSEKVQSMEDFLNDHFNNAKQPGVWNNSQYKLAFVLDDLEKLRLDIKNNKELTDLKEAASMDVLLTNLIKGTLLPSDRLWIISQPSGVDMIPPEYIHKVTECRENLTRRQKLVSNLRIRFCNEYNQDEDETHPNQKNTEHILREDSTDEINDQDKRGSTENKSVKQVNSVSEIFKDQIKNIRTVLTIGEADIGKTFHMKKFIKQWAKNKRSVFTRFTDSVKTAFGITKDEEVIFPLCFSKLSQIKDKKSLVELLNHFFEETRESVISDYEQFKLVFVLDGLEKLPLDFEKNETLTDVRKKASVNVLLTNLQRGNLLPSAQLWISSRPSDAKNLPADSIDRTTEIRGRFLPPVYIIVFIVGLVANGWGLKLLLHNWTKLKIINVFVLNLGLADILYLLTLPFLMVYYFLESQWIFGDVFCKITRFCFNLNLYGSIGFLTCISVYRYLAVVHPVRVRGRLTLTHSVVISVMVWLLVSVQSVPDMFYTKTFGNKSGKCYDTTHRKYVEDYLKYSVGWTLTGFCIPFLIILGCYGHMAVVLWTMKRTDKVQKQRNLRLLFILILLFSVCYIPYHVFKNLNLWSRVLSKQRICHGWCNGVYIAHQISRGLVCLNSALNPLVYLYGNEDIAAHLRQLFEQVYQMFSCLLLSNSSSVPVTQTADED